MKKKKIVIILAVLVMAAAAYFLFAAGGGSGNGKSGGKETEYVYAVKASFVTNVKDSVKLFKATIVLVADEGGLDTFFKEKQCIIRDVVLFELRDLTEEDIRSPDIMDRLRTSLPASLNAALETESIISVYFTDFVMQ